MIDVCLTVISAEMDQFDDVVLSNARTWESHVAIDTCVGICVRPAVSEPQRVYVFTEGVGAEPRCSWRRVYRA